MSHDLRTSDPDGAFDRVAAIAGDDFFEPRSLYALREIRGPLVHFAADPNSKIPAGKTAVQGVDNYLFTGLDAFIDRLAKISIHGSGNVVFLGADCRFSSLRVTIRGNGNFIYIGAFATGGEMHVDIAGNGRLIRVGEDAMLARTRLAIGLGRKIVVTDAAGQRLSPVSGRPPAANSDIVIDGLVWVGREALITEGVHIGSSAVIGARSLVISDVAGATISAGSPARRLRTGVTFSRSKALTLAADRELSRHGHRDRRVASFRTRIAEGVAQADKSSLTQQLQKAALAAAVLASDKPPVAGLSAVAATTTSPFWPSSENTTQAHRGLLARAGHLPIDVGAEAPVVRCIADRITAREQVVMFAHVSSDGAQLGKIRCRGRGNYLFSAAGCDLSLLDIDLDDVSDTLIYIGAGVAVSEPSTIRVAGNSGGFVHIGRGCRLGGVTATVSGPKARLVIGTECLLDGNVTLRTADGFALFDQATGEVIKPDCTVAIGDRVYIGLDSVIAKGASVGSDSVVAPRSVVTGELDANCFHSGFPALVQHRAIRWSPCRDVV